MILLKRTILPLNSLDTETRKSSSSGEICLTEKGIGLLAGWCEVAAAEVLLTYVLLTCVGAIVLTEAGWELAWVLTRSVSWWVEVAEV